MCSLLLEYEVQPTSRSVISKTQPSVSVNKKLQDDVVNSNELVFLNDLYRVPLHVLLNESSNVPIPRIVGDALAKVKAHAVLDLERSHLHGFSGHFRGFSIVLCFHAFKAFSRIFSILLRLFLDCSAILASFRSDISRVCLV